MIDALLKITQRLRYPVTAYIILLCFSRFSNIIVEKKNKKKKDVKYRKL